MIDEQSSASGHDYASDRSAIGAGTCDLGTACVSVVPGVMVAIIPMSWNVFVPSMVLMLWSTWSAGYYTNCEP